MTGFKDQFDKSRLPAAIEYLITESPMECYRCNRTGATASCYVCGNWYHGFGCARVALVKDIKFSY